MYRIKAQRVATSHRSAKALTTLLAAVFLGALCGLVPAAAQDTIFLHEATASNSFLHVTQIDHPAINDDPDARFVVQHVANPGGTLETVENSSPVGVSYSTTSGRWSIDNQDLSAMAGGTKFFVFVSASILRHDNSGANTSGFRTFVDSAALDGRSTGWLIATFVRTRSGASGGFNDHPIAMEYEPTSEQWTVINQDGGAMPTSGGFAVAGFAEEEAFAKLSGESYFHREHTTTLDNTSGSLTRIDGIYLDDQPNSFVFATAESNGVVDAHVVGVVYDVFTGKWALFHPDGSPFPIGTVYQVLYHHRIAWDDFETGDLSRWTSSVP